MCRSVWKLPASESRALRSDSRAAATSNLNRFTEVEIGDDHLVRLRADQRARSSRRCAAARRSSRGLFQLRISERPIPLDDLRSRSRDALGIAPSELPSR